MNLNKERYKEEPFILTFKAKQVFYVPDPTNREWSIVLLSNKINENVGGEFSEDGPL